MSRRILVTGATGKVGVHFTQRLLADARHAGTIVRALCHQRTLPPTPRVEVVRGAIPSSLEVRDGELVYEVDVLAGHKTGHYLDQRLNRARIADNHQCSRGFGAHIPLKTRKSQQPNQRIDQPRIAQFGKPLDQQRFVVHPDRII